ncbi:MAG: hypothetical protein AAF485_10555 [Chloroflexota bacterium]
MTATTKPQRQIPIWIMVYAVLQLFTAFVGLYGGYIDPSFFYTQFPDANFNDPLIRHLAGVWGSKNLATILIMVYSLIRQHPRILGTAFLAKGIADTVDILYTNSAFLPDSGLGAGIITWLIVGLPSLIAAYILFKRSGLKF